MDIDAPNSCFDCVNCIFFSFTVDILLKAVGDTPIMKTKKWAVERTRTIQGLIDFIKKFLKLVASEQLVRKQWWSFPYKNSQNICLSVFKGDFRSILCRCSGSLYKVAYLRIICTHSPLYFKSFLDHLWYLTLCKCYINSCWYTAN